MAKYFKISNLIVLSILIFICVLGTFYKHISFGLGLADIIGYLFLYIGTIIHLVLTIVNRKKGAFRHLFLAIIFLIFTVTIILNATIWRGNEYSWNGSIFYLPCPTEIKVNNPNTEKDLLITMCSMQYYSEFSGTWDGDFLTIENGEIKIPEELEKYINRPIEKVKIEPDFHEIIESDKLTKEFYFNKDTLTLGEYKFSGEISAIRDMIPVVKVRIE
jgi:type IV secretory pathway VirB3-like protein